MKCKESLSNRVSNIVRRYIDRTKFAAFMAFFNHIFSYSLGSIFYHCIYGCMFCMLLFNFANHIFLSLCLCILIVKFMFLIVIFMFYSVYSVSLCCSGYCFMCKCVMYYSHRVSINCS